MVIWLSKEFYSLSVIKGKIFVVAGEIKPSLNWLLPK